MLAGAVSEVREQCPCGSNRAAQPEGYAAKTGRGAAAGCQSRFAGLAFPGADWRAGSVLVFGRELRGQIARNGFGGCSGWRASADQGAG